MSFVALQLSLQDVNVIQKTAKKLEPLSRSLVNAEVAQIKVVNLDEIFIYSIVNSSL